MNLKSRDVWFLALLRLLSKSVDEMENLDIRLDGAIYTTVRLR